MTGIAMRIGAVLMLTGLLAGGPAAFQTAAAQSKNLEDALGGEKSQEVKPKQGQGSEVKSDGGEGRDGAKVKPEGDSATPEVSPREDRVRSRTNPACDPTFGGRYANLVRKLYIPRDRRQYGMCRNWGRWNGRRYKGFRFRSGLYWTFDGTHWYLFATRVR